jgi:hypothetical protein
VCVCISSFRFSTYVVAQSTKKLLLFSLEDEEEEHQLFKEKKKKKKPFFERINKNMIFSFFRVIVMKRKSRLETSRKEQ